MKYLVLYHYGDHFKIVDSKKELERELYGIDEDTIGNGMVTVYNESNMKTSKLKMKTKPAWTVE